MKQYIYTMIKLFRGISNYGCLVIFWLISFLQFTRNLLEEAITCSVNQIFLFSLNPSSASVCLRSNCQVNTRTQMNITIRDLVKKSIDFFIDYLFS